MTSLHDRLPDLISGGESHLVEFKKSLSSTNEGLESLCGMLNSEHAQGYILFGVAPDGSISGIEPGNLDKAQRTLVQKIHSKYDPPIMPIMQIEKYLGDSLLVLCARRDPRTPYHEYDGRAFIREGTTTRQLTLAEKQVLGKRRNRDSHNGPWKCDRCGSVAGMLLGFTLSDRGMTKSYGCECGGEFWPAT